MRVIVIALLTLLLDQSSKYMIRQGFGMGESVPLIPGVFHITYIVNRGAAFGILENQRWFFLAIVVALFILFFLFYKRLPIHTIYGTYGSGLLLGGALGNAIDRFYLKGVTDFFDFRIWPIFNFADIGIVLGVCLLVFSSGHFEKRGEK